MGSRCKSLAIVAMGASLVAFSALGSAQSGGKVPKKDSGCCCGDGAGGACCSEAGGTTLLARADPASAPGTTSPQKTKEPAKASKAAVAKGIATRKALLDQVSVLMDDGVADCCIEPGCGFCPIAADGCSCAGSLAKGGPVCPECWGGWHAGQGMLPDVKAEKVQVLPKDQLQMLYGMKAKKLEQASKKK